MVRNLIIGGSLRPRGSGKVYIYSPSEESINQPLWNAFTTMEIPTIRAKLIKKTMKPNFNKGSVVIFDDVDDANKIPYWVQEIYSIESHHSDISVIKISHKAKCNDTLIRGSTQGVVLFNLPPADMLAVSKDLSLPSNMSKYLSDDKGLKKNKDGTYSNYNCVFVDMRSLYKPNNQMRGRFYKIDHNIF